MKISIIIPVYNSEKYIEKVLNSILNQTYKNYEIVIVNDGSTDNSEKIIKNYNNKEIKYISIKNSGPGIARKIGFKNSNGDLLFFVDSDDYLPSNDILQNINDIYMESKFDVLLFNFIRKSNNKEKITNILFNKNLKEKSYDKLFLEKNRIEGALWGKIFVKNKFDENFFCDYKNYEDYYTTYAYLNNCEKIFVTKKIFYYANRDNENSISKKYDAKKILDTIKLLEKLYSISNYKDVISTIICNYYTFCKYNINKFNITNEERNKVELNLKELKTFIKLKSLLKVKHSSKIFIKLIYINMKDVLKIRC